MSKMFGQLIPELTEHLNYRSYRHGVISSNIANVETPGYRAKETLFEKELDSKLKLAATDAEHVTKSKGSGPVYKTVEDPFSRIGNDSNTVDIDREMMKMNQNQVMHEISAELITRKFSGMKTLMDLIT